MGRKLRRFVGALKDKASLTKAAFVFPPCSSAADIAVLRATSHDHPSSPPHPHHISALLSFGHGARPAACALSSSLSSRLLSTRNPSVALKSLLLLHLLLRSAPFILLDSLFSSLLPKSSGHHSRSPLLLSSFPLGPDPLSWSLSSCVRWYSRLLELRLLLPEPSPDLSDWVSSLLTRDLIAELDTLVKFLAEASSPPEMRCGGGRLVAEVEKLVIEDRIAAENGILARLGEFRERIGAVGFADAVELVFVLRRLEDHRPSDARWMDEDGRLRFWNEVKDVKAMAEEVVVKREVEARKLRSLRAASASDRFAVRTGELVVFGSNRSIK